MTKKTIKIALFISFSVILFSFDLPSNWFIAGSKPNSYEMGIDNSVQHDGKYAATIKSNTKSIKGFGTLMQSCLPDKYLGKKVKISGFMRSENVTGWAGFWFRVDQANSAKSLAFDNMQDRAIKGTTEWKQYEIILEVPKNASNLAYGALLSGTGQIWFSNIKFEEVSASYVSTGKDKNYVPLSEPANLNFEK